MTPDRPQGFRWDGEAMLPLSPALADKAYCVGETYLLVSHEDRSGITHRHQFAWIREAWKTLPENLAMQFPTPGHLRKRALIDCGFYDETIIDAGTKAAAVRVCSHLKRDDFKLVFVRDHFVIERSAKSQSHRAMGKADFQRSKEAILELISDMLQVTPEQLTKAKAA